jgi:hypothetical protein
MAGIVPSAAADLLGAHKQTQNDALLALLDPNVTVGDRSKQLYIIQDQLQANSDINQALNKASKNAVG